MYNKCDSLTSRHEIILDTLTINQSEDSQVRLSKSWMFIKISLEEHISCKHLNIVIKTLNTILSSIPNQCRLIRIYVRRIELNPTMYVEKGNIFLLYP